VKAKGGRPRVDPPGARVTTWIRSSDYDRLLKLAQQQDKSISGVIRELLKLKLPQVE
jgi:predicted CopG family antitoxin